MTAGTPLVTDSRAPTPSACLRWYRRSTQVAKLQYYTLGFWTPESQTTMPDSMRSIEGTIRGESNAQWDPTAKALDERLLEPDQATVDRILAAKAKAVSLAEENIRAFESLFAAQLRVMRDHAAVWEAWARAYWTTKLVQKRLAAPADGIATVETLEKEAKALDNPAAPRFVAAQQRNAKKLADDLRANLAVMR